MHIDLNYPGLHLETIEGHKMYVLSKNITVNETLSICYDVNSYPLLIDGKVKAKKLTLIGPSLIVKDLQINGNVKNPYRADIFAYNSIRVRGNLEAGSVVAENNIEVSGVIDAYYCVRSANGKITASSIFAGEEISAKVIDCKKRIFAGISLFHTEAECYDAIWCEELVRGEICHGTLNPADDQQESDKN